MKKLYIIPGWEDDSSLEPYQKIAEIAKKKGYDVVFKNINWKKTLSQQVFEVHQNDSVFGFSLGAVLAWLVAQDNPCEHLILASKTLHKSFEDPDDIKALTELAGKEFVNDIIKNLTSVNKAKRQTVIYGALEGEMGDVLVPDTEHELTENYIKEIEKLL